MNLTEILLFYPTDHKSQDSDSTISVRKCKEETEEKEAPPSSLEDGFLKVDSVVVDHPEDKTSIFDKPDGDLKTAVDWTDVSGQFYSCEISV